MLSENDIGAAHRRARRNKEFWCFVFAGNGLTYTELKEMDLADYREAVEARILWQEEWHPKPKAPNIGR